MSEQVKLGKVAMTLGGDYSSSQSYDKLTCVQYDGCSWVSKKQVPEGVAPTPANSAYWQKISDRGLQGATGAPGQSYVDKELVPIVNDLTTGGSANVLSAEQGKVLKGELAELSEGIAKEKKNVIITSLTQADSNQLGYIQDSGIVGSSGNNRIYRFLNNGYNYVSAVIGQLASTASIAFFSADKFSADALISTLNGDTTGYNAFTVELPSECVMFALIARVADYTDNKVEIGKVVSLPKMAKDVDLLNKKIDGYPTESVKGLANYTKRGIFVNNLMQLASSNNYVMTDPIKVSFGEKIEVYGSTPSKTFLMFATSDGTPIVSLDDNRTLRQIVPLNSGTTMIRQEWVADEDCYVIVQNYSFEEDFVKCEINKSSSGLSAKLIDLTRNVASNTIQGFAKTSIKTTSDFVNRGLCLNSLMKLASSQFYYMSKPIHLNYGDKIEVYGSTPSMTYLMFATDTAEPITSLNDKRTFRQIVDLNTSQTPIRQSWTADCDCYVVVQNYIEQTAFNQMELYLESPSISKKLSKLNESVQTLEKDVEELKFAQDNYSATSILWFSDVHVGKKYTKQLVEIVKIAKDMENSISDVLHTGDSTADVVEDFGAAWSESGADNILNVVGNHDVQSSNGTTLTAAETYQRFFAPYIDKWGVVYEADKCYYYKDYDKVRLVVVDCMHEDTAQTQWLIKTLEDAKIKSKAVMIACHYPPYNLELMTSTFTSILSQNQSGDFITWLDVVNNFISSGGEFVCWLCGHRHRDYIGVVEGYTNQLVIDIENASCRSDVNDGLRMVGTVTEISCNLLTIDTHNHIVSLRRIGNNSDMYNRKKNNIVIDYANKKILGNW